MRGTPKKRSELRKLIRQIIEKYQPDKIILFGSYAYGNPDENSDADILIIKETDDIPFHRRVKLRKLCQDPHRHIPFQPLVVSPKELASRLELGDPFFKEIIEKGEVCYVS
ncbi:MAG: nucleotidyltransferase domain-containing protein [bacterium]